MINKKIKNFSIKNIIISKNPQLILDKKFMLINLIRLFFTMVNLRIPNLMGMVNSSKTANLYIKVNLKMANSKDGESWINILVNLDKESLMVSVL